jgi:radial spoke head protein 3
MDASTAFMYASEPHAVGTKRRTKYRNEEENDLSLANNIMHDRRVVRGNTYGAQVVTQNAARELDRLRLENERAIKREVARRHLEASSRPLTPPPVVGRAHMETMTDTYLEELSGIHSSFLSEM